MSSAVDTFMAGVVARDSDQKEFHQAVQEVVESLMPVFDKHPEYFAEIDGKRIKERVQPCLTNSKVIKIMAANVMALAASSSLPNGIVSVSQDDYGNYCQCSRCRAALILK